MTDYVFTLKLRLPPGLSGEEAVERLGAAGCTDALAGIGLAGRLALEFTREAESAAAAVGQAMDDMMTILPDAEIFEVGPDLVGLSDMADLIGLSRQALRKSMLAHADFPSPVHHGSSAIWHLSDVLEWMESRPSRRPDPMLSEVARAARAANFVSESQRLSNRASA